MYFSTRIIEIEKLWSHLSDSHMSELHAKKTEKLESNELWN